MPKRTASRFPSGVWNGESALSPASISALYNVCYSVASMREIRHSVCPHDCPSQCALTVTVDGGRVTAVAGDAAHPLFHALGASQLDRTICVTTGYSGWMTTVGTVAGSDAEQMVDSDLVVLWGINASYTHINLMSLVKRARERGALIVCIDPYRTQTAKKADLYLQP